MSKPTPMADIERMCEAHEHWAAGCADCHVRALAARDRLTRVIADARRTLGLGPDTTA